MVGFGRSRFHFVIFIVDTFGLGLGFVPWARDVASRLLCMSSGGHDYNCGVLFSIRPKTASQFPAHESYGSQDDEDADGVR